jgi:predicted nucleic acid-binding protein
VTTPRFVKKSAIVSRRRTVIVDAGPLKAAIDRGDVDHAWAVRAFRSIPARFVTCEAAIAEAQHGLENHPTAIPALRRLVGRMDIVAFGPDRLPAVFDEIERWSPRMDFADGCAVVLARSFDQAFVLTTGFRDFSTYGVPFASPEGAFTPDDGEGIGGGARSSSPLAKPRRGTRRPPRAMAKQR